MKKWLCKVCGYIYEGPEAPAECPVCHAKSNMFEEVKGELKLAAEHEFGVYGKTVKNNPDISEEDKKKITTKTFAEMKKAGEKVTMLTAYDISVQVTNCFQVSGFLLPVKSMSRQEVEKIEKTILLR